MQLKYMGLNTTLTPETVKVTGTPTAQVICVSPKLLTLNYFPYLTTDVSGVGGLIYH